MAQEILRRSQLPNVDLIMQSPKLSENEFILYYESEYNKLQNHIFKNNVGASFSSYMLFENMAIMLNGVLQLSPWMDR